MSLLSPPTEILLQAYYHLTLPQRVLRNGRAARHGQAPVMVVFYHRVADHTPNARTVTNRRFERQIRWIRARFDIIALAEAQRRIRSGENRRPAVCITFDDGYADNCDSALPMLIAERIPFTYFVTSSHLLDQRPFPHDEAAGQPLTVNSVDQLLRLVDAGVEIGAHTRTHADLGRVDDAVELHQEVVNCRQELQSALGCPIRYFAFPYGLRENLNDQAFRLAKEAGYDGVCSAYGGYNFPGDDAFHLQRFHGDPQTVRLKNWLTLDPRKQNIPRYEYRKRPLVFAPEGGGVL